MTAISPAAIAESRNYESPRRVLAVTRLLFVNRTQMLYLPLSVLAAIFLLNLGIWWIIIDAMGGLSTAEAQHTHLGYNGAVSYVFVYAVVIAVQAFLRTFPFSLGFGVTRRDFYLGAALAFVILGAILSAVLTIMSVIEDATGGWGVGGRLFAPVYFTNQSWLLRFVMYLLVFLFCMFVGALAATLYARWRAFGIIGMFGALTVLLFIGIAYATLNHTWPAIWAWIGATGAFGLTVWTLVPTAIAAVAGFFLLRGATPKS